MKTMEVYFVHPHPAPSALESLALVTWAVSPGYRILRPWRSQTVKHFEPAHSERTIWIWSLRKLISDARPAPSCRNRAMHKTCRVPAASDPIDSKSELTH